MLSLIHQPILYLRQRLSDKNFLIVSSVLVGLTSGLAAVALKYLVHAIGGLVPFAKGSSEFMIIALFPLLGILLTVFYVKYFMNGIISRGSAEVVYAIVKKSASLPGRDIFGHLITSAMTVGFGGSVGLESPMVSSGSSIGSNYAKAYSLSIKDRTALLGCGAAAGIAAAFNSPIAGVLFTVEVLLTEVSAAALIPLIIAAACGALLSKIILSEGITLAFSLQQPFDYTNVPYYIALGILCGLAALLYARIFVYVENKFHRIGNDWVKACVGGLALFSIIAFFPPVFGEGYQGVRLLEKVNPEMLTQQSVIGSAIQSDVAILSFVAALIFVKMFAAAITVGSGGNGGSFAPSLVIGSYLGFAFSHLVSLLGIRSLPVSNFTLVAMAGILSGVFYAPLTAIFLIAEITGGYGLMIPLMIVSSLSLLIVHFFEPMSMESKKLSVKLRSTVDNRDKLVLSRLALSELIETNFSIVPYESSLHDLVKIISSSNRNIFPVVNNELQLVGLIYMDKVRSIMFDSSKYHTTWAKELMTKPDAIVELDENLHEALQKFENTQQWNLPVIDKGKYIGFLSKSSILTRYRKELVEFS
jgi:CIC family chloride channel protein